MKWVFNPHRWLSENSNPYQVFDWFESEYSESQMLGVKYSNTLIINLNI